MRRPVVLLLFAAVFVGEAMWSAIIPLVPEYAHRFALSPLESGFLLASASVAILIVSIPAGMVGDRFGVRRVTLVALALIALGDAGQGVASSFWGLVAARTLFGVGFGALWTTGLAWLSEAAGERGSKALALTVTTAGVGNVAGPAFAGVLVDRYGLAAPFTVAAVVTGLIVTALALETSGTGHREASKDIAAGGAVLAALHDRLVVTSLVLMALGGMIGGAVNLLVPLELHRDGVTAAGIGAAFAASAVLFIGISAGVAHLGDRAVRASVGAAACAFAAAIMLIPLASTASASVVVFLLARGPVAAVLYTVTFPLGAVGGREAGIGVATVAALLNIVWAASMLVAPVAAGAVSQAAGDRAAYAAVAAMSVAVAVWIASTSPPAPARRPALGESRSTSA
ncbi:MAG TPA: MFS transporter [Gaiellales bacterium]|nr:MFS transporter [Gaiellales bacterium]